ncbi:MAG: hypothetical protein GX946_10695, partial [Oligosphaeraceae bacterium]|nr:hypothetical protein [Oligosphaeraceae bacterium]
MHWGFGGDFGQARQAVEHIIVGAVVMALAFLVAGGDRRIDDDVAYAVFPDEDAVGFEAAEAGLVHAADIGVRIVPAEFPGNRPCACPDDRKAGNRLPDKMRITVCANCGGRNCRESLLSKKTKM